MFVFIAPHLSPTNFIAFNNCSRLIPPYIPYQTIIFYCLTVLNLRLNSAAKEYCQFESFNISCSLNQVIVMEDARYGRLQLGRCVNRDYGFIGCSANVLDLLDRSCSGQRACQFHIPTLRDLVQPCPRDLTSYLEASYRCVSGGKRFAFLILLWIVTAIMVFMVTVISVDLILTIWQSNLTQIIVK